MTRLLLLAGILGLVGCGKPAQKAAYSETGTIFSGQFSDSKLTHYNNHHKLYACLGCTQNFCGDSENVERLRGDWYRCVSADEYFNRRMRYVPKDLQ